MPWSWRAASTPSASRTSATTAEIREQEIGKLATEAELRALRAQINPHFLFNALTTIGYLIQTAPPRALETLLRLTALLRGVLRSEGEFTTLGRELEIVEAYLDIERARFEQRLRVTIDVPAALAEHSRFRRCCSSRWSKTPSSTGSRTSRRGGDVAIRARIERIDDQQPHQLVITVEDTGAGASSQTPSARAQLPASAFGTSNGGWNVSTATSASLSDPNSSR